MRKTIFYTIILSFALLFSACSNIETPTRNENGDVDIEIPEMNPPLPLPEYPIIDGSTSTVTMHSAIRAYLTDAHFVDPHSQTYAALERLVPGNENPADVVLAVKYYDETLHEVKERGADLVITPIAKEGFVFILHKDNPIDSLTQQQLRDIYSGKITNWKEIGGKDEEIIPYTRNWDSGSQTAMENFMNGEPVIGKDDNILSSMLFLLTQVQDTGSPGIGYNIYSWSMGQNLDGMGLKVVAVDGVKPENKTLSDSSYPLMVYTYSYYNNGNAKGKALTDWLLTAEGQDVIASVGYVGIYGELSTDEMPDLNKDEWDSTAKIEKYYKDKEVWNPSGDMYHYSFSYCTRLTDLAQTEALADGKGKKVTVLYLVYMQNMLDIYGENDVHTRFIVLTREKGGAFEIINEGEVLLYENGIIYLKL